MFEDLSSRISKVTNLKYLTPIVLYNSDDKHYYLSLLYRIQSIGVHHILCSKLKEMDVKEEIPQLIEIMLKPIDGSPISYPIYYLLLVNSRRNISFRVSLFFRLKCVLGTVDENMASHCYFLCCAILELDSKEHKRNIASFSVRRRIAKSINKLVKSKIYKSKKRIIPLTRQFSITKKSRLPDFYGLMLFFTKSITSMFNPILSKQLDEYYQAFENKKNYKNLQFKLGQTGFKSNIMFYESLADISCTIKKMPDHLRQRTLRILLEFTNLQMGREIIGPFNKSKKILKLVVEYAKTQDSAENCPFVVVAECANRNFIEYNLHNSKLKKTKALLRQLESLNDLEDIGDIVGIKESILCAIENILFSRAEVKAIQSESKKHDENTVNSIELIEENKKTIDNDHFENSEIKDQTKITDTQSCAELSLNTQSEANLVDNSQNSIKENVISTDKPFDQSCPNLEINTEVHSLSKNEIKNADFECKEETQASEKKDEVNHLHKKSSMVVFSSEELGNLSIKEQESNLITGDYSEISAKCNSHLFSNEVKSENAEVSSEIHNHSSIDKDANAEMINCINIENVNLLNDKEHSESLNALKNFDTLVSENKFAELVPSLSLEPRIIYDLPKEPETKKKREFVDAYACDNFDSEPLAISNERSTKTIRERLAQSSPYSKFPGWGIISFIVKSGGVLKHEYLAYQALTQMKEVFILEKLPIYLKNYQISLISDTSGLVEMVQDAQSIHRIKYETKFKTLLSYFEHTFKGENLKKAKENFLYSLVGYSLASYILQIKDRHNGNLLIDSFGHIIHVDFGFTFGKFPGIVSIENAPFKFSTEYLDLIDLEEFKDLFIQGLKALGKHREKATRLIEIMKDSGYYDKSIFEGIIHRFKIGDNDTEIETLCQTLISNSLSSKGTAIYDHYQYYYNGYL